MFQIESMKVSLFPKDSFDGVLIIQILEIFYRVSPPKTSSCFYIDLLWYAIKRRLYEKSIFGPLGVYYRHPKKPSNVFLEKLTGNLNKITNSNTTGIIAGDFNYDILQYEYNKYSKGT